MTALPAQPHRQDLLSLALIALSIIVLAICSLNIALLWHFPLYIDEPQWKLINSSLFSDNFSLRYFFPACASGYILPLPSTWVIPRLIDSFLYGDASNVEIIRPIGIVTCIFIIVLLSLLLYRSTSPKLSLFSTTTIVVLLCSGGAIFPLIIMNRPEQAAALPFLLMMTIYAFQPTQRVLPRSYVSWLWALTFSLLTWTMLAQHIKSFVLIPAIAIAAFIVIRRVLPYVLFVCLASLSFIETYSLWLKRTDCPEVPSLQATFGNLSLSPHQLLTAPFSFVRAAVRNLFSVPTYFTNGLLSSTYQSEWMPSSSASSNPIIFISNVFLICCSIAIVVALITVVISAIRRGGGRIDTLFFQPATISLAIFIGILLLGTYQTTKNFYETSLVWPLLLTACVVSGKSLQGTASRVPRQIYLIALAAAMVSQVALFQTLQGYQDTWQQRETEERVALADADEVGQACGLKRDHAQTGLVVDDVAYRLYWKTYRPVLSDFFIGWWARGLDVDRAVKSWPIEAIIARCPLIPVEYRTRVKVSADGAYCCAQL